MTVQKPVILLAEDDDGHASLVQRNLKRVGVVNDIVHVHDGQETLDYIHGQGKFSARPDRQPLLLMLDINMPRINGEEVLRQVKQNAITRALPVIMLTTADDSQQIQRCYALGCSVYMTKPVLFDAFAEAMKRLSLFLEIIKVPAMHA